MRLRQLLRQFVFLATGAAILQPICSASPAKTPRSWTLVATGDLIGDVVATTDPRTREVWKITKAADVALFNMEGQIFDEDTFTGHAASENGGENYYGGISGGPSYLPTKRLPLLPMAVAGTHTPQSVVGPGDPNDNLQPRPGVSALRATPVTVLDKMKFDTIRDIALAQGQVLTGEETDITLYVGQSPIAWSYWRLGTEAEPSLAWNVNPDDYTGII
ncbi:hypothetical protein CEP53_007711 [Fusarium sp. AF-6]|nr:hypothetical protein CEP53_007711 [Fusarium sp. AF-6]